jgi:hypothetical protein
MLFYIFHDGPTSSLKVPLGGVNLGGKHCWMGSLGWAAYMLIANANVLRWIQQKHNSPMEHKGKSCVILFFYYKNKLQKHGLSCLEFVRIWS